MYCYCLISGVMPGSGFPERNSIAAPPPVEMWVNLLVSSPSLFRASAVSPPPIIEVQSVWAIFSATVLLPCWKDSISQSPSGPFQMIVFDLATISANFSALCLPMSKIFISPETSWTGTFKVGASSEISSATVTSCGRTNCSSDFSAFSMISWATSFLSAS